TLRETGHRLPEGAAPPRAPMATDRWRWNRHRVPYLFQPTSTRAALSWPENRVFRRRFVRSYPNFQLEILPRFSTKLIKHQELGRSEKRPSRGRSSSDHLPYRYAGSTTGLVRASAPPSKVKNFGIGQNTEETLPNFRQKSKEI
ncbi:hypothetical protein Prudu_1159S000100, partial [Prunus dulcis]